MEPREQTGDFILSIGARKWKCQSGGEGMSGTGAMAPLCSKHLIYCLFCIFPRLVWLPLFICSHDVHGDLGNGGIDRGGGDRCFHLLLTSVALREGTRDC